MRPAKPVAMKAACQPKRIASIGTRAGAMIAPTFDPELKMPVASARSFFGNHSATTLMLAGKLPDSPRPRRNRAKLNPPIGAIARWSFYAPVQKSLALAEPIDVAIEPGKRATRDW